MNLFAIPPIITFFLIAFEGMFVWGQNRRAKPNVLYGLFCLSLCIWLAGFSLMYLSKDAGRALFWARNGFFGIIFVPVFAYHFITCILDGKRDPVLIFLYISVLPSLLVFRTKLVYSGVSDNFWGYYPTAGGFYLFFLFCFLVGFTGSVIKLILSLKNAKKNGLSFVKINQIKYLLFAFGIGTTGVVDYAIKLPCFNIYPWGYLSAFGLISFFAMAIIKHRLLDIDIVIKKTLIFTGLFLASYFVFSAVVSLSSEYLERFFHSRYISIVPAVFLIVLIFRPLESFLVSITDRYLFQKKYDYRELLKTFTTEVLGVLDINYLVALTVNKLAEIVKLESASILLYDQEIDEFRLSASFGIMEGEEYEIKNSDGLWNYALKLDSFRVDRNMGSQKNGVLPEKVLPEIRSLIDAFQAALLIPLIHQNEVLGLLLLGKKKSDEDFTLDDIGILLPLANTISIAITNAKLVEKLSQAQAQAAQREKMAVIGTLSAGINHEICNPLGIIRGQCEMFLLNYRDGIYNKKSPDEVVGKAIDIMQKVVRETDRATGVTKKLSAFAKPAKGDIEKDVSIKDELDEVISLIEHELALDNVEIAISLQPGLPHIEVDPKQLQEVLFNIIRNGVQAMKDGGKIDISACRMGDSVTILIKDTGEGVDKKALGHIFDPFYTTKDPGKGTGLGLFIVKQVVEKNKGTIMVESELGSGSVFSIAFKASTVEKAEQV